MSGFLYFLSLFVYFKCFYMRHFLNSEDKIQRIASTHPISRIGQPEDISSLAYYMLT